MLLCQTPCVRGQSFMRFRIERHPMAHAKAASMRRIRFLRVSEHCRVCTNVSTLRRSSMYTFSCCNCIGL